MILSHDKEEGVNVVKAVVFDVDGTLMDSNYLHVEAWARALEDVGHRAPRAEIHPKIGKSSSLLVSELVQDEEVGEKVEELHTKYYDELQRHARPLPGAKEIIDSLARQGYEVWLATSAAPEELEGPLEELEAEGRISGVVYSKDVEDGKPAPDIFGLALEKAGAEPGEAVAVGDAIWDIESAGAAGIRSVGVMTGGAFSEERFKDAGAVRVYKDCAELLESGFPDWLD